MLLKLFLKTNRADRFDVSIPNRDFMLLKSKGAGEF